MQSFFCISIEYRSYIPYKNEYRKYKLCPYHATYQAP